MQISEIREIADLAFAIRECLKDGHTDLRSARGYALAIEDHCRAVLAERRSAAPATSEGR